MLPVKRLLCRLGYMFVVMSAVTTACALELPSDPAHCVRVVADAVLRDHPDPREVQWQWGEGVLMAGMMRAYLATDDPRYRDFVQAWADQHLPNLDAILRQGGTNYCGVWGPGFPVLLLYEATGDERYLRSAELIVQFFMTEAGRTADGGIEHRNTPGKGQKQLWADTPYMMCPLLSHAARLTNTASYQEASVTQMKVHLRHLFDPEDDLCHHMYDEAMGDPDSLFWGRGNGWVAMSLAEMLRQEPRGTEARQWLEEALARLLQGLVPRQDPVTGLWRTIVDDPSSYTETSVSAMVLYGMAEVERLGLMDLPYEDEMRRAWEGLCTQIDAQGHVIGVSRGTGPSAEKGYYVNLETGTYPWGTGAFLMAAAAYAEIEAAEPRLLFKSTFGPGTRITEDMEHLTGVDATTGFDWDNLGSWVDSTRLVYLVSKPKDPRDFMLSEIVNMPGPDGAPAKVLHLQNKGDDPDQRSTSRNEFSLYSKAPPDDYKTGYVRYWMKLQEDLDEVIPVANHAGWYMIMEWKEPDSGTAGPRGGSNNYRININIDKDAGSSQLYWLVTAEEVQPERKNEWRVENRDVPVPLGEWFLVEAYMKKDAADGRVFFAVNGETVCDKRCRTQHKDNPLPLRFWSIFKLYHGEDWLRLGPTNNWYTDLELWSDFPPGRMPERN